MTENNDVVKKNLSTTTSENIEITKRTQRRHQNPRTNRHLRCAHTRSPRETRIQPRIRTSWPRTTPKSRQECSTSRRHAQGWKRMFFKVKMIYSLHGNQFLKKTIHNYFDASLLSRLDLPSFSGNLSVLILLKKFLTFSCGIAPHTSMTVQQCWVRHDKGLWKQSFSIFGKASNEKLPEWKIKIPTLPVTFQVSSEQEPILLHNSSLRCDFLSCYHLISARKRRKRGLSLFSC